MLLPDWNGRIAYVMKRCMIQEKELAIDAGMSRPYLCKVMNSEHPPVTSRKKIDDGLRSCLQRRGIDLETVLAPTQGFSQSADS